MRNKLTNNILKSMNVIEELVGERFNKVLPEFEQSFWLAQGHEKELKRLNNILNQIILDIENGKSFVLDRANILNKV